MTSTFLHEDKNVPPDELAERDAPACEKCGNQLWLIWVETSLSDHGTRSTRKYECSQCGNKQTVHFETEQIAPMASGTVEAA